MHQYSQPVDDPVPVSSSYWRDCDMHVNHSLGEKILHPKEKRVVTAAAITPTRRPLRHHHLPLHLQPPWLSFSSLVPVVLHHMAISKSNRRAFASRVGQQTKGH